MRRRLRARLLAWWYTSPRLDRLATRLERAWWFRSPRVDRISTVFARLFVAPLWFADRQRCRFANLTDEGEER